MGSYGYGSRRQYSGGYSDVATKSTDISDADKAILDGDSNWYGYFQTSESWRLNKAIREHEVNGVPLDDAIRAQHPQWNALSPEVQESRLNRVKKTLATMDKNMKPLDADINVVRLTTGKWLLSMLKSFGLATPDLNSVDPDVLHYIVQKRMDKINNFLENNDAIYYDKTFQSATYNLSLSDSAFKDWHHPVRIEYVGTKGTKALFSPTGQESEVVFDRKSGLNIKKLEWDNDHNELIIRAKTTKK